MIEFLLGMNAKLYFGASTVPAPQDPATFTEMSNVRDVKLTLGAGEADVTTRANSGWRATAPTLRECTCEFEMVWKPGDAGFEAVKTAYLNAGTLALAALTCAHNTTGSEGPIGNWSITDFSRNEPLEEAIIVSVTAKLASFGKWYVKEGS